MTTLAYDAALAQIELFANMHANPEEWRGLPSGLTGLDQHMGGFPKKPRIIEFGAPAKTLKTTALVHAGRVYINAGMKVLYVSREEAVGEIITRHLVSNVARPVSRKAIRDIRATEEDFANLRTNAEELKDVSYWLESELRNIEQVRNTAKAVGAEVVIIDYLQLFKVVMDKGLSFGDAQMLNAVSKALIDLKRDDGLIIITAYQIGELGRSKGTTSPADDADVLIHFKKGDASATDGPSKQYHYSIPTNRIGEQMPYWLPMFCNTDFGIISEKPFELATEFSF